MRLCVVVARNRMEIGSVERVCIICRMDVVARVDTRFDSSTILRLSILSFMLTGCDGCIESDSKSLSRSVGKRSLQKDIRPSSKVRLGVI